MDQPVKSFFQSQVIDYARNFEPLKTGVNFQFNERLRLANSLSKEYSDKFLDCAVGTGEIAQSILSNQHFQSVDLVDISANMLTRTQDLLCSIPDSQNFNFIEDDIFRFLEKAIQSQKQYNLILCLGLIAHVGKLDLLLDLLSQCLLADNGRLILQTTLLDHLGTRFLKRFTANRYYHEKGYSISYFYLDDIISSAKNSGLNAVEIIKFGLSIPGADRIFPKANFYLEQWTQSWQREYGSEALIAFEVKKKLCD